MDKVVVGLGNPGSRYEGTRHNLGWMVVDRLAQRGGSSGHVRARDGAASVRARIDDLELLLVKPTTYMNLSGSAVRAVLARERVPLRDLLVVVDDFALPFGRLRIRERGSDGGHNGLRSIIGDLGTQGFARLRVGIGEPERGAARQHVLAAFGPVERARLDELLEAAAECVIDWAKQGPAAAAARWNGWQSQEDAGDEPDPKAGGAGSGPERPAEEPAGTVAARDAGATPEAGDEGIVRSSTGWRRILHLPTPDRGRDRGSGQR